MDLPPPGSVGDGARRWEVVGEETGEDERPAFAFGARHVAGILNKAGEIVIRNSQLVDGERRDADAASGAFSVGVVSKPIVGAHHEFATGKGEALTLRPSSATARESGRMEILLSPESRTSRI